MYTDLSILPTNSIECQHLIKKIPNDNYHQIALDFEFVDTNITAPKQFFSSQSMKVHTRATLAIEQNATLHQLSSNRSQHLLLAVKPLNQKIFQSLCVEYDNYDIITFDYTIKMPFMLKRNPVYQALRKGKYFQIQYNGMFDDDKRVICMTNIVNLIKATNGKNIIVSSHSQSYQRHRTPYDVCSLLVTLGMTKDQAFTALSTNPQNAIKSALHRAFFKGSIQQIPIKISQKLGKKISKHRQAIKKKYKQLNEQLKE